MVKTKEKLSKEEVQALAFIYSEVYFRKMFGISPAVAFAKIYKKKWDKEKFFVDWEKWHKEGEILR